MYMKKPEIISANISGCIFAGPLAVAFVAVAASGGHVALPLVLMAICNAPVIAAAVVAGVAG